MFYVYLIYKADLCSLKPMTFPSRSRQYLGEASFHPEDGHGRRVLSLLLVQLLEKLVYTEVQH